MHSGQRQTATGHGLKGLWQRRVPSLSPGASRARAQETLCLLLMALLGSSPAPLHHRHPATPLARLPTASLTCVPLASFHTFDSWPPGHPWWSWTTDTTESVRAGLGGSSDVTPHTQHRTQGLTCRPSGASAARLALGAWGSHSSWKAWKTLQSRWS